MAHGDATFLSKLKNAWDLHFSKNTKLILILCGSVSAWNYLAELECSGYIKKSYRWQIATGKLSRLFRYRLTDNYLRFYFKFLMPKLNEIDKGRYANITLENLPGWRSILGLQFENLVLNNRELILKSLNLHPEDVVADDPLIRIFSVPHCKQKAVKLIISFKQKRKHYMFVRLNSHKRPSLRI